MEGRLSSFEPSPIDIKEGKNRKIYLRIPLDDAEQSSIQVFRKYTRDNDVVVPDWVTADENRFDLKFMDSMHGDPKKAVDFMNQYASWLLTLPVPEDEVMGYMRQGLMYVTGRSLTFCPVIIVNVRKIIDTKIDFESLCRVNYFVLNWIIENMIVPGKVETWIIIQDMKDVGVTQIPKNLLQPLSERLSCYFSLRLNKCFTINVPMTIGILWGIAKHFIDKETRKKIFIERKGWDKKLAALIEPNNLEVKYGGSKPNLDGNYYPFNQVTHFHLANKMASKYLQLFPIPEQLPHVVRDLTREILRYQPQDIIQFCALYFKAMQNKTEFIWTEAVPRAPRPSDYKKNSPKAKPAEVPSKPSGLNHEESPSKQSKVASNVPSHASAEVLEQKPGKIIQSELKADPREQEKSGKLREGETIAKSEEVSAVSAVSAVSSLPENSDQAAQVYVSSLLEKVQKHIEAST